MYRDDPGRLLYLLLQIAIGSYSSLRDLKRDSTLTRVKRIFIVYFEKNRSGDNLDPNVIPNKAM